MKKVNLFEPKKNYSKFIHYLLTMFIFCLIWIGHEWLTQVKKRIINEIDYFKMKNEANTFSNQLKTDLIEKLSHFVKQKAPGVCYEHLNYSAHKMTVFGLARSYYDLSNEVKNKENIKITKTNQNKDVIQFKYDYFQ